MRTLECGTSTLLVVDFQVRLMPSIVDGSVVAAQARRLLDGAGFLAVPAVVTEQNSRGLGPTLPSLLQDTSPPVIHKMTFDACRAPGFAAHLADRPAVVVTGCETHVCVLQTVLGLLDLGRRVYVARDAVGSRTAESKEAALRRMERHGAEIVTTEMVLFEWLGSAEHPRFRDVLRLIK